MDLSVDFELLSIVVGVVAVTAAAVYLVSVMGVREKSFEEAIAEQKQRSEQLLGVKPQKEKKKIPASKGNKKQQKRSQKQQQSNASNGPSEKDNRIPTPQTDARVNEIREETQTHHHVEIDPEPEFLDERPIHIDRRRSSVSGDSIRSILINKLEHSPVSENAELASAPIINHFEAIHPKDDCEMKMRKNSSQDSSPPLTPPPALLKQGSKKNTTLTIEDSVDGTVGVADSVHEKVDDSKGNGKSRNRKGVRSTEKEEVSIVKLEETITKMPLSSSEIQSLIDILLNKQHGDSEWVNKGRNDSAANLKRLLADKEQQLLDEQSTIQTLHSKIKELRQEFNNEKSTFAHIRRQLEDSNNAKKLELQQIQARFQNHCDSSQQEKTQLQQQIQQAQVTLKSLRDENVGIKSALASVEQGSRGKADSLEREAEALRVQCSHLENQLQAAFNSNQEQTNRIQAMQSSFLALEERKQKDEQLAHGNFASQMKEREAHFVTELKRSQAEGEKEKNAFRQQINILQNSVEESKEVVEGLRRRYEDSQKSEKNAKNLLQDAENKVKDIETKLRTQDAVICTRGDAEKMKEEEFLQLQARLEKTKSKLEELEMEKINLCNELDTKQKDVTFYKQKNDELRMKNNKLMETLTAAEVNLEHELKKSHTTIQDAEEKARKAFEKELKESLKYLLPYAVIDNNKDWVKRFVESLKRLETENSPKAAPPDPEELTRLNNEVKHYQTILVSTETMLKTLQESVEKVELDWRIKLEKADEEIAALKAASLSDAPVVKIKHDDPQTKSIH